MSLPLLILIVVGTYFLIWQGLSLISSRGADNSTFFSGRRKMPWPLVAIAMIGAPITGVTFVSVPGMVMTKSFSYLQMCLGFMVGYLIIALVLVPLYYKLNIVSIYGFLQQRFGQTSYKTGAWLFFVSKVLGISIRFLVVCTMLQFLVFDPLGIPYICSVLVSLLLIWVSTFRGGVKSVIWSDTLKSFCLILTVFLSLFFILEGMGFSLSELPGKISNHFSSRVFFFDDPADNKYFWKQFVGGIVLVVAMTGLDQDMMQRTLACPNARDAKKNLMVGCLLQVVVISMLLALGTVLLLFVETKGLPLPDKSDNLFATVAFHPDIPVVVGALFVLGIISATFVSVGSALTAMTTTVTVDLLEADKKDGGKALSRKRNMVHALISILLAILVLFFYYLNEEDAISTVYAVVSYTDGPILGLFLFGILTKRKIDERWLPAICVAAPLLSWLTQWGADYYFAYKISYELIILNAGFTLLGLYLVAAPQRELSLES